MIRLWTIDAAQRDMRQAYRHGGPGVLASGAVWLAAGMAATAGTPHQAMLTLFIGSMAIHPLAVLACRLLGSPGRHGEGNPLGRLAMEGVIWLILGLGLAWTLASWRPELFFCAMLLMIGGRYLTFATLYGMRIYWLFGAVLAACGMMLASARVPMATGAFAGGAIEVVFGAAICFYARRRADAGAPGELPVR